jgi:hypothetical protein
MRQLNKPEHFSIAVAGFKLALVPLNEHALQTHLDIFAILGLENYHKMSQVRNDHADFRAHELRTRVGPSQ